jgi:RNA polymerase sigma-70 factor, ECF subfamily
VFRFGHIPGVSPSVGQSQRTDNSFERLYRRHRRDVYGAVLRDVRDPEEAEDVTQIAFLNAYRAMSRGEEPKKPRAWLVTIARNVVRRRYRAMATRPQEVSLDPEVAAAVMDVDGPTAGEIAAAIRKLPTNQRAAILLREIQGRSYAEIAKELGLSLAAVETLIFRARRTLSEELEAAEYVPAIQPRRSRGLFFLPLPGLGKLGSLGLSFSRAGAAALVGGIAIVVGPFGDTGKESRLPPMIQGPPSFVEESGFRPARAPLLAPTRAISAARQQAKNVGAKPAAGEGEAGGGSGPLATVPIPSVPDSSGLPLPTVPDPSVLPVPPLPIDPPPLPPAPGLPPPPPLPG